jgi:hypothetical protein
MTKSSNLGQKQRQTLSIDCASASGMVRVKPLHVASAQSSKKAEANCARSLQR